MSKSILSVNGNKAMNYLLQTIFQKEYRLVQASDVFEGMYQLKTNNKITALIVDLDYETQQGWELIEHIKSSELYDIPVVVLTTENNDILQRKCYQLEVDEIFFKPFNPVDLIATIKNTIAMNSVSNY
jgi:CheY-like chemotaxis protein